MSESTRPERVPVEIKNIFLTPPPEIERQAPQLANSVRLYGTLDALTLNLYYLSPNLMLKAAEGREVDGMRLEGSNLHIESLPVARVSITISTAFELVGLIVQQAVQGAPFLQQQMEELVGRITSALTNVAPATAKEPPGEAAR